MLAAAARAGVFAAVLALACCFTGYLFYSGTDSFNSPLQNEMLSWLSTLTNKPTLTFACTWMAPLLVVLLTILLRRLWTPTYPGKSKHLQTPSWLMQARRLLAWQLPPRAVLASWCGGLSVAEALGVLGWLGLNAWWLGLGLQRTLGSPGNWQDQLQGIALLFGQMIAPNLMLLFLPIPHTNVVTWLTGVPRNRLIRFHRWLGHGTLWVVTLHSILFYVYWAVTNTFWENFKAWDDVGDVSNLAGTLAFACVLVLWVTSLSYIRRRFYEFFFRCHIACFVGFFLLSCAHYSQCWLYFAPGLLLYAADLVLRAGQLANITTITAAAVDRAAGLATLQIKAAKALKHLPMSEVWLLLPAISRFQWHPFSVASGGGRTLTLHIKTYGRFTQGLLAKLQQDKALAVRLSGPMGAEATLDCQLTPPASWRRHEVLVCICGGVGVTSMLGMLRAMLAQRARQGSAAGLPRRVVCIWTARRMGEFLALDAGLLLAAASGPAGWLTLQLHLTGTNTSSTPAAQAAGAAAGSTVSKYTTEQGCIHGPEVNKRGSSDSLPPGGAVSPMRIRGASPYFWNLLRPAQPLTFGSLHLTAVYLLVYFGAFCAVVLGSSFVQLLEQQWLAGMLMCILMSAMAMGLPFMLAVFPVHLFRYWRSARAASHLTAAGTDGAAEEHAVVPGSGQAELVEQRCAVDGLTVLLPGEGIAVQVQRGRPDPAAALRAVAAAEPGVSAIGVFAGGPSGLTKSVHLAVCQLNSERAGSAYFELHNESVEL